MRQLLVVFFALVLLPLAAHAQTTVPGSTLASDTVWDAAHSPYLLQGDVTVAQGATLTIEPGVVVNTAASDALRTGFDSARVELLVKGTLKLGVTAAGGAADATKPVVLNGTVGTGGARTAGSWGGINFDAGASATGQVFKNADLGYATTCLTSNAPSIVLEDSLVHHCSGQGLNVASGASLTFSGSAPVAPGPAKARVFNVTGTGVQNAGTVVVTNAEITGGASYGVYSTGNSQVTGSKVWLNGSWGVVLSNALANGTQSLSRNQIFQNYQGGVSTTINTAGVSVLLDHNTLDHNDRYAYTTYELYASQTAGALTVSDNLFTNDKYYCVYRSGAGGTTDVRGNAAWGCTSGTYLGVTPVSQAPACNPLYVKTDGTNYRLTANSPARLADSQQSPGDVGALPYLSDATPVLAGVLRENLSLTAEGGPYTLAGDLTVAPGVQLTLQPGAVLNPAATDLMKCGLDAARVELKIQGSLSAAGTSSAPVTVRPTTLTKGTWYGLSFDPTSSGNTLSYVDLGYALVGLATSAPTLAVSDSKIHDNSSDGVTVAAGSTLTMGGSLATSAISGNGSRGIFSQGTLSLTSSTVSGNASAGIQSLGNTQLAGNDISGNGVTQASWGVIVTAGSSATTVSLSRNVVHQNGSGLQLALNASGSAALVEHNTFDDDDKSISTGYELWISGAYGPITVRDNILTNNKNYGMYRSASAPVTLTNNLVWNCSTGAYYGVTAGPNSLTTNPLYAKTDGTNYRLTENSPARDADSQTPPDDLGALPYLNDPTPGLMGILRESTTLTAAGSPWAVPGDLTIPAGVTLTLEPGARLVPAEIDGMSGGNNANVTELVVHGTIIANGTAQNPIVIRPNNQTAGRWDGLRIESDSTGNQLSWLDVGYGTSCLQVNAPGVTVSNTKVHDCSQYGVNVAVAPASLTFTGDAGRTNGNYALTSAISNCAGTGLNASGDVVLSNTDVSASGSAIRTSAKATIAGNVIRGSTSSYGITATGPAGAPVVISRNVVYGNAGGGIYATTTAATSSVTLDHNTVDSNSNYGLLLNHAYGTMSVKDNLVTRNGSYGVYRYSGSATLALDYNDVWGQSYPYYNCYAGTHSLLADPLYNAQPSRDYRLQPTSPVRGVDDQTPASDLGALPFAVIPVGSVQVSPASPSVLAGATQTFIAQAIEQGTTLPVAGLTYQWNVAQGGGSIGANGLFTAGCTPGTYASSIVATTSGVSGSTGVTVVPGGAAQVVISPDSRAFAINERFTYTASAKDACGNVTTEGVNWSLSDPAAGVIDSLGNFTAGVKAGAFPSVVRATSKVTGAVGYASLSVNPGALAAITVSPQSASVTSGASGQFTASGKDQWANAVPVTPAWSLGGGCALGTLDAQSGVFTAGSSAGTCSGGVVATQSGVSGSASVTVTTSPLASLTVAPTTPSVAVGGTVQFTASGRDASGTTQAVAPTWSVSGGGSITQGGLFTAGCAPGTFTVTATQGSVTATQQITVRAGALATITVTPGSATVGAGQTVTFSAAGKDTCGNAVTFTPTWSVVAGGGSIASTGVFTAGAQVGTYQNTVRASSGAVVGSASVSVTAGALASLVLTPDTASVQVGATQQFSAAAKDAYGNTIATPALTWSASSSAGSITQAGLFTAGSTAGTYAGAVRVTGGNLSATATVNVLPGPLAVLTVSPTSATVAAGATQQFTATAKDAAGNTIASPALTWSVVNGGGTIGATGLFTAGARAGSYANTVKVASGSLSATASVTVTAGALVSLTLSPGTATVKVGQTQQFTATGADASGNTFPATVTWSVVNGGGSITSGGVFTAMGRTGTYANTVKATSGSVSATASVQVDAGALAQVVVSPDPVTLAIGGTQQFSATGSDAAGNVLSGLTFTWAAPSGVGSVTQQGLFTAGTQAGTFTKAITATNGSVSGGATVTVTPGAPARLALSPNTANVPINGRQQFTATAYDSANNPTQAAVSWSVAAGGGAIDQAGLFTAGTQVGTFSNTVKATSGALSATASVLVVAGPAASITIQPGSPTAKVGDTVQFTAAARDAAGNAVTAQPTWSVVNGGGFISTTGSFTAGTLAGTFGDTVRARLGNVEASATVTVTAGAATQIIIDPSPVSVRARGSLVLGAVAADQFGNPITITPHWSMVTAAAGSIQQNGLFTAGAVAGTYRGAVSASANGLTGKADVTVQPGPVTVITVAPASATLKAGDSLAFTASGKDTDGNTVTLSPAWTALGGVGVITPDGRLTAGDLPGSYPNSVKAQVGSVSGTASVTITAADVARLQVAPSATTIAMGKKMAFTVTAFGSHGQVLQGVVPTWSVKAGGGTIDQASGQFTAGTQAGFFPNTVQAQSGQVTASASVTVPDDFDRDGMSDAYEVLNGLDDTNAADANLDADGDGLLNVAESKRGTKARDADSDDDGVLDGNEPQWSQDTDDDGLINALDPDSDGDGILDGTEMAVTQPPADTDLTQQHFVADADPQTSTDPLKADTDGDTLPDGQEDTNHDGKVENGETDPNTPDVLCPTGNECQKGQYCVGHVCRTPKSCEQPCASGETCSVLGVCEKDDPGDDGRRGSAGCGCNDAGAGSLAAAALLGLLSRRRHARR